MMSLSHGAAISFNLILGYKGYTYNTFFNYMKELGILYV